MLFQLFRFLLRRLAVSLPLVVAVVFVTFMLVRIGGGDPVALLAGPTASQEEHAAIRSGLGLDKSLIEQFGIYVSKAARGDLGQSWLSSKQVIDEIFNRAVVTLESRWGPGRRPGAAACLTRWCVRCRWQGFPYRPTGSA